METGYVVFGVRVSDAQNLYAYSATEADVKWIREHPERYGELCVEFRAWRKAVFKAGFPNDGRFKVT